MSGRNPPPRRSYGGRTAEQRRADRRERLLAAGLELFGTRGYAATSIERLCATASVSTRNFYEEFAGREELLLALHRDINERASEALTAAYTDAVGADLPTRVERAVRAFVTVTASDPRWARIAFVEVIGVSAGLERHRLRWRSRWEDTLVTLAREAVARGEAADRDYRLTMIAIIGAVNNLVHHWSARDQHIPLDNITAELTSLICNALARRPQP
ncbi:TetR/AcrR family transcriptional regulator, partial [Actinomadura sp. GC306]|uniref:TetR/AcrR family transcriptional regulator n=1 Tax=Actinomadura sp. GC306 TaxID=2530367 RepID=UPI00104CB9D8